MKKSAINLLLYTSLALVPLGTWMRAHDDSGARALFALGLLGILIYLIARIIKTICTKGKNRLLTLFLITLASLVITLFARYLYHTFWDYAGIITIVAFLILLPVTLLNKEQPKDHRLISIVVLLSVMSIPLFGIPDFYKAPRKLIPQEWYNRFDVGGSIGTSLPWTIDTDEALACSERALALRKANKISEAIEAYKACLAIVKSPRFYFEISQLYARDNELEVAIQMMDSVMLMDSTNAPSYSNRGLLFYKLKQNDKAIADYEKAILLDSTNSSFYLNLGLALYFEDRFKESCINFEKAESMGLVPDAYVRRVRKIKCN